MKLAEALALRADLQNKLASLRERIGSNVIVLEGKEPNENPDELLKEAFGVLKELRELVSKINETNSSSKLPDGSSITEAIAKRDELTQQHSLLDHAVEHSTQDYRYLVSDVSRVSCVDVKKLQKQSDDLAGKIRELNLKIQEANWNISLV